MFGPHHQHFLGSRLARTFDELDRPTKCLFHPTFALLLTSIASVHPQVRKAGELLAAMLQERLDSLLVHKLGAVDLCFEYEALGVHQQVTLAALDLLSTVETALFPAHPGRFDRLAIHYPGAGLGIPVQANAQTLTNRRFIFSQMASTRHFLK